MDKPDDTPTDPREFDIDTEVDGKQIAEEVRKTTSLSALLTGATHRTAKVLIFTDAALVDEFNTVNQKAQELSDRLGKLKKTEESLRANLLERFNAADEELEQIRLRLLESSLTIHLQAYPNIVDKIVKRDTRKKFADDVLGGVPNDRIEEAVEWQNLQLLSHAIVRVVNADGVEMDLGPKEDVGQLFSDTLSAAQWQRLYAAYEKIKTVDSITQASITEPGF